MSAWTRLIIRNRKKVLALWVLLALVGGYGAANVGDLLSNRFSVPGSDAERGLNLLKDRFDERGDGAFTLVVRTDEPTARSATVRRKVAAAASAAAAAVEGGRPGPVLVAAPNVAYVQINTPLQNADAAKATPDMRAAVPAIAGA
jgi:RND superfamily putative drug exporter